MSNTATLTVNNGVGIRESSIAHLFSVYPNPFSTQINLKADKSLIGTLYNLYDYTGKTILTGKIQQEITPINMEQLSVGLYLLTVGTNRQHGIKILKE